MKKLLFLTLFLCSILRPVFAQEDCGAVPSKLHVEQLLDQSSIINQRLNFLRKYQLNDLYQIRSLDFEKGNFNVFLDPGESDGEDLLGGMKTIPVVAHILRQANGTGGLTEDQLNASLARANNFYNDLNMNFVLCSINFIDDNSLFSNTFSSSADRNGTSAASYNVLNVRSRNRSRKLNIYFVPNSNTSWAPFLNNNPDRQHIMMLNAHATNPSTLSHEIGHWFDLLHTHETATGAELVDGTNCGSAGDLICDTPADPNLSSRVNSSCDYTGGSSIVDSNGDQYSPDSRNIMSYTRFACRSRFSEDQIYRLQSSYLGMRDDRGYTFGFCLEPDAVINNLCYDAGGWRVDKHPRMIGDINGDGRDDIIGFGQTKVFVELGQADGTFRSAPRTLENLCYDSGGWRVDKHPRMIGDVNGDGRDDIIGFGQTKVFVELGQADGTFRSAPRTLENLCYGSGGWRVDKHPRMIGDINGDGRDDIVGFGETIVFVELGTSTGTFRSAPRALSDLCYSAGGWRIEKHPRFLADINGDGQYDLLGFGNRSVFFVSGQDID